MNPRFLRSGLLLAILLLASALRLYHLNYQSYWGDEIATLEQSRAKSIPHLIQRLDLSGRKQLPYYVITHVIGKALGWDLRWYRWLSALAGISAVLLLYCLGNLVAGPAVGLLAAAILTVSPVAIHYSQEARVYSLLIAAVLAATLFLWKSVEPSPSPSRRWRWQVGYFLCAGVCLLLHSFSATVIGIHLVWALLYTEHRRFASIGIMSLLLTTPLLRRLLLNPGLSWIPEPHWSDLPGFFLSAFQGIALLLPFVFLKKSAAKPTVSPLLLGWAFLPAIGAYAFSLAVVPVWCTRYLLQCLPALFLLAALGLNQVQPKGTSWLLALLLLGGTANLFYRLDYYKKPSKPEFKQAMAYISEISPAAIGLESVSKWYFPTWWGLKWYLKTNYQKKRLILDDVPLNSKLYGELESRKIQHLWWFTSPYSEPLPSPGMKVIHTSRYYGFDLHLIRLAAIDGRASTYRR